MSLSSLQSGRFESIGESYILQLAPITGVNNFVNFSDTTQGEVPTTRELQREFRYRKNLGTWSGFLTLSAGNLAAIVSLITDQWDLEIRYTRVGTDNSDTIHWKCFKLDGIRVTPCVIIKIKKSAWDAIYGTTKFAAIDSRINEFNIKQNATNSTYLFLVIDETLPDRDLIIERVGTCTEDVNLTLQSIFGNGLIDSMFREQVDTYDGLRTL